MLVEAWHPEPGSSSITSGHSVPAIAFPTAVRGTGELPGLTGVWGWEAGSGTGVCVCDEVEQVPGTTPASIYPLCPWLLFPSASVSSVSTSSCLGWVL